MRRPLVPLCPNDKQTDRGISLKLRNPDGVVPEQLLNHEEGEVATLEVDHLWRPSQMATEFDEIGVRGNHCVAVLLGPCPDSFVRSLLQADVPYVSQPRKERQQPCDQAGREVLIQEQAHPRFALRPTSAAN